jgi:hypothetical protein
MRPGGLYTDMAARRETHRYRVTTRRSPKAVHSHHHGSLESAKAAAALLLPADNPQVEIGTEDADDAGDSTTTVWTPLQQ